MRRLIWGFAGRTYHIVGNLMHRLIYYYNIRVFSVNAWTILDGCIYFLQRHSFIKIHTSYMWAGKALVSLCIYAETLCRGQKYFNIVLVLQDLWLIQFSLVLQTHALMSLRSVCNKVHKGVICNTTASNYCSQSSRPDRTSALGRIPRPF